MNKFQFKFHFLNVRKIHRNSQFNGKINNEEIQFYITLAVLVQANQRTYILLPRCKQIKAI